MKKTIFASAIVLFSFVSFGNTLDSLSKKDTIKSKIGEINKNTLYNQIVKSGIQFPQIVLAQDILNPNCLSIITICLVCVYPKQERPQLLERNVITPFIRIGLVQLKIINIGKIKSQINTRVPQRLT
jgi:hypothetical protein